MTENGTFDVPFYRAPLPCAESGLRHGFFSRRGGVSPPPYASLNTGPASGDDPGNLRRNIERIASAFSAPPDRLVAARQVHGAKVEAVHRDDPSRSVFNGKDPFQADALTSDQTGIWLGILTADCLPVLFFDPVNRIIGAAHAGWRGTRQNIAARTVQAMTDRYRCRPDELWAALGPCIGPCCYVVGEEVAQAFLSESPSYGPYVQRKGGERWRIDLAGINQQQLLEQGLVPEKIHTVPLCTKCREDLFFSVRAQGEPTGRQLALIGMNSSS